MKTHHANAHLSRLGTCLAAAGLVLLGAAVFSGCGVKETPPLLILVSNDDGIDAPGIIALAEAMGKLGAVTVATNPAQMSGVSHAMTTNALVSVRESTRNGQSWLAIDALPATCVRMALDVLLPKKPDIVVAGVNKGENTGVVSFYSATVACAREASFQGIPAVAVHLQKGEAMDYQVAAEFTAAMIRALARRHRGLVPGLFLNVNVPARPKSEIKGVIVTHQDTRPADEIYELRESRDGESIYWATYKPLPPGGEKTDVWAVANGYISITPMSTDQTDVSGLARLRFLERLSW